MKNYVPDGLIRLEEARDHDLYFEEVARAFKMLLFVFAERKHLQKQEVDVIEKYLGKMLASLSCLRFKYQPGAISTLQVDLTDSGFPSYVEFSNLETDLAVKNEALKGMSEREDILNQILDILLENGTVPYDLIQQMAFRQFYDDLNEDELLFTFTKGDLAEKDERAENGNLRYLYDWACYDFITNRLYLYRLDLENDKDALRLRKDSERMSELTRFIFNETLYVQKIGTLAAKIDKQFASLHPKKLSRTTIGPMCSAVFSKDETRLAYYLKRFGGEGSFAILSKTETVESEKAVESGFLFGKTSREVFRIPKDDPELDDAQATRVERLMILPHEVLQELSEDKDAEKEYRKYQKFPYNKRGYIL
jgi:hypothetical protein